MTREEFVVQVAAKNKADLASSAMPEAAEAAALATVHESIRFLNPSGPNPQAVDPTFWLTIIQLLAPIILEWINRRFPKPTPTKTPNP